MKPWPTWSCVALHLLWLSWVWQPSKRISDPTTLVEPFVGNIQLRAGIHRWAQIAGLWCFTIISISTNCITGEVGRSLVTYRCHQHQDHNQWSELAFNKAAEMQGSSMAKPLVSANHTFASIQYMDTHNRSKPIPLIEDPITMRAIAAFDRIPTSEFHRWTIYTLVQSNTRNWNISQYSRIACIPRLPRNIGTLERLENCKEGFMWRTWHRILGVMESLQSLEE